MLRVITTPGSDFDCLAVRRGRDVVVCVAERLLSPRGAVALTAVLTALSQDGALLEKIG